MAPIVRNFLCSIKVFFNRLKKSSVNSFLEQWGIISFSLQIYEFALNLFFFQNLRVDSFIFPGKCNIVKLSGALF